MMGLRDFFRIGPPPHKRAEEAALKEFDRTFEPVKKQSSSERDRTARILANLRCEREGNSADCRVNVSWEDLAEEGRRRG